MSTGIECVKTEEDCGQFRLVLWMTVGDTWAELNSITSDPAERDALNRRAAMDCEDAIELADAGVLVKRHALIHVMLDAGLTALARSLPYAPPRDGDVYELPERKYRSPEANRIYEKHRLRAKGYSDEKIQRLEAAMNYAFTGRYFNREPGDGLLAPGKRKEAAPAPASAPPSPRRRERAPLVLKDPVVDYVSSVRKLTAKQVRDYHQLLVDGFNQAEAAQYCGIERHLASQLRLDQIPLARMSAAMQDAYLATFARTPWLKDLPAHRPSKRTDERHAMLIPALHSLLRDGVTMTAAAQRLCIERQLAYELTKEPDAAMYPLAQEAWQLTFNNKETPP